MHIILRPKLQNLMLLSGGVALVCFCSKNKFKERKLNFYFYADASRVN